MTLVDQLLEEQANLTAVERFSQRHDGHQIPLQETYYRDLIPLSKPKAGEQYAFEVDLDRCSSCKACVTACHNLNGLDEGEVWRSVGLLMNEDPFHPYQQAVTTACHHCVDPACSNGCPVQAYEKDEVTGIVKHLDDQCIGCQYCILKCPYDVPKYHHDLGIVRKCDMCHNRLENDEAPACVQACPTQAIRIVVVNQREVGFLSAKGDFLEGVPWPEYTQPTTRYKSNGSRFTKWKAADIHQHIPQHSHLPLVFMLVLTQLSVGMFFFEASLGLSFQNEPVPGMKWLVMAATVMGFMGLASSFFHLGRPRNAWKSFLGLRTSWLSREIMVFGLFASSAVFWNLFEWGKRWLGLSFLGAHENWIFPALMTVGSGLAGVFCSWMVYHDTKRDFWIGERSGFKFFGSTILLGSCGVLLGCLLGGISGSSYYSVVAILLCLITLSSGLLKMSWELIFIRSRETSSPSLNGSALLMLKDFKKQTQWRFVFGGMGIVSILVCFLLLQKDTGSGEAIFAASGFVLLLMGEFLERYLFFTCVKPLKMPGGVSP